MSEIIEGKNPVVEALRSGRPLNRILTTRRDAGIAEIVRLASQSGVPVEYVIKSALDRISQGSTHQGVIAYAAAQEYVSLDDLLSLSKEKNEAALYCVLDGIEDPHNLGAIIRTADAAGIHGIVIRSRREVGLTAVVAKASAGAIEYVPVARVTNITQAILDLKKSGVWVVGIDPAGPMDSSRINYTSHIAIVIGGEGKGLSELVRKKCDYLASIPMRGKIPSLNASVAAALVMYEAFRQRSPPKPDSAQQIMKEPARKGCCDFPLEGSRPVSTIYATSKRCIPRQP